VTMLDQTSMAPPASGLMMFSGFSCIYLQELLSPLTASITWLQSVLIWEEPLKSITFCVIVSYIIYRCYFLYLIIVDTVVSIKNWLNEVSFVRSLLPTVRNRMDKS
jgi:hypothetical protein